MYRPSISGLSVTCRQSVDGWSVSSCKVSTGRRGTSTYIQDVYSGIFRTSGNIADAPVDCRPNTIRLADDGSVVYRLSDTYCKLNISVLSAGLGFICSTEVASVRPVLKVMFQYQF